jgi:hypothetical protein
MPAVVGELLRIDVDRRLYHHGFSLVKIGLAEPILIDSGQPSEAVEMSISTHPTKDTLWGDVHNQTMATPKGGFSFLISDTPWGSKIGKVVIIAVHTITEGFEWHVFDSHPIEESVR